MQKFGVVAKSIAKKGAVGLLAISLLAESIFVSAKQNPDAQNVQKPIVSTDFSKSNMQQIVGSSVIIFGENHGCSKHRYFLADNAQFFSQNGYNSILCELVDQKLEDSVKVFMSCDCDSLSKPTLKMLAHLETWFRIDSSEANSYEHLVRSIKKSAMNFFGANQKINFSSSDEYMHLTDSIYAHKIANFVKNGEKVIFLSGALHPKGIKCILDSLNISNTIVLFADSCACDSKQFRIRESAKKFFNSTYFPILPLLYSPGLYRAPSGYLADYVYVLNEGLVQ